LPQVLVPLRPPNAQGESVLFTRDFLLRRKFHRLSETPLTKVGLIFARSRAMVDCAAQ
jgi:hypothetical protein